MKVFKLKSISLATLALSMFLYLFSNVAFSKPQEKSKINANSSSQESYINVIVRKHLQHNKEDVIVDNSYNMCIAPSQYPCVINLNHDNEKISLLFHSNTNLVDINYIEHQNIKNEQNFQDKIEINKVYLFDKKNEFYSFNLPEIETTKNLNNNNETKIELKFNTVK